MNIIGKIFVFAVFVMSLVFMAFSVAIYSSHTNYKADIERSSEEETPEKPLGWKAKLEKEIKTRETLTQEIDSLIKEAAASELARDQIVAKLQSALVEKNGELVGLRKEKIKWDENQQQAINFVEKAREELKRATTAVLMLREEVKQQQTQVDGQVDRVAKLAAELHEKESFLVIANERKAQLEKQVANARLLLKQSGLSIDSQPKDRVPSIDGVVVAVADDAVEVSLGGDDGVQMGHELEVYRNDQYLGRVRVVSVKPDKSIAIVIKAFSRGAIQQGDRVATRLKA